MQDLQKAKSLISRASNQTETLHEKFTYFLAGFLLLSCDENEKRCSNESVETFHFTGEEDGKEWNIVLTK